MEYDNRQSAGWRRFYDTTPNAVLWLRDVVFATRLRNAVLWFRPKSFKNLWKSICNRLWHKIHKRLNRYRTSNSGAGRLGRSCPSPTASNVKGQKIKEHLKKQNSASLRRFRTDYVLKYAHQTLSYLAGSREPFKRDTAYLVTWATEGTCRVLVLPLHQVLFHDFPCTPKKALSYDTSLELKEYQYQSTAQKTWQIP